MFSFKRGFIQSGFLENIFLRRLKKIPGMTIGIRVKQEKGFTLIELLVVIAIIALLSSVVLASLSTARMKGRDAKRISDLHNIRLALEMYYDANGNYPTTNGNGYNGAYNYDVSYGSNWNDLATKLEPYIKPLPKDPINSSCAPWVDGCYAYYYGNVGDGNISAANINGLVWYDLLAQLETPNHSQSCGKVGGFHYYYRTNNNWCASYSKQIYADTPF